MTSYELFVQRQWVENGVMALLNLRLDGHLSFRVVHPHEPENDRQLVLDNPKRVRRPLDRLLEFCKMHDGKSFDAEPCLDGVVYTVRHGSKTWSLFCPEASDDAEIVEIGELLDALLDKLWKMQ